MRVSPRVGACREGCAFLIAASVQPRSVCASTRHGRDALSPSQSRHTEPGRWDSASHDDHRHARVRSNYSECISCQSLRRCKTCIYLRCPKYLSAQYKISHTPSLSGQTSGWEITRVVNALNGKMANGRSRLRVKTVSIRNFKANRRTF